MNIDASPALLETLRRYAEPYAHRRPPIFAHFPQGEDPVFPFEPGSDKGLGILLLCAALYRPGGDALSARVVAGLYRRRGNDVFRLNRAPFEALRAEVEALAPDAQAEERARIPGILRSACDFFYRVGPLGAWLDAAPDWETRVGELCHEVYWMGARSRTRNKARRFLWLACCIPGFGARHAQARAFAWPVSDGHMRFWIDIVKPPRPARPSPESGIPAFAALARAAFPEEPWRLYAPLEDFLRRERRDFACRGVQGGCRACALAPLCPSSRHFE